MRQIDTTTRHILVVSHTGRRDSLDAALEVCALLVREGLQKTEVELRYVGFRIPPAFVLGYGLDVGERYRNLPYICEYRGA